MPLSEQTSRASRFKESDIEAVVFDCDGVLVDSDDAWRSAEAELFARHHHQFGDRERTRLLGLSLADAGVALGDMLQRPERADQLSSELYDLVLPRVALSANPVPGVERLFAIAAGTVPIAVASNSPGRLVEIALTRCGFRERIDVVVASEDVATGKPAPDPYLAACRALAVEPARALAVEDSIVGVRSAERAGLRVIWVGADSCRFPSSTPAPVSMRSAYERLRDLLPSRATSPPTPHSSVLVV
jgi:HAD superfamily hydrolase (TIGR01509 family)